MDTCAKARKHAEARRCTKTDTRARAWVRGIRCTDMHTHTHTHTHTRTHLGEGLRVLGGVHSLLAAQQQQLVLGRLGELTDELAQARAHSNQKQQQQQPQQHPQPRLILGRPRGVRVRG